MAGLGLGLLLAAALFRAISGDMPEQTFVLESAGWLMKSHGRLHESHSSLTSVRPAGTECECVSFCLQMKSCLSYSFSAPASECTMNRIRGNRGTTVHEEGVTFRYRRGLAMLGDWCDSDEDCSLLTSRVGLCLDHTCSCPPPLRPLDRTTCGEQTAVLTSSTESYADSTTAGDSAATQAATSSTTPETTSPSSGPSTAASAATETEPATTVTTAEPTSADPTSARTTTESAAPVTTAELTTTTVVSTTPTTAAPTTVVSSTAASVSTDGTTSTTTEPTTTSPAPSATFSQAWKLSDPEFSLECSANPAQPDHTIVGIQDTEGSVFDYITTVKCAQFSHLPDLALANRAEHDFERGKMSECPANKVMSALLDHRYMMFGIDKYTCADVLQPYYVDTNDCQTVEITEDTPVTNLDVNNGWPVDCPDLPEATAAVGIGRATLSDSRRWAGLKCCKIKKSI